MPIIKMSEVESSSGDFAPLDPGEYNATVYDIKSTVSKAGNDRFNVQFKIEENNRRAFETYPLVPNVLWKLRKFMLACGMTEDQVKEDHESVEAMLESLEDNIMGNEVILTLGFDTYEGKFKNRVTDVAPMTTTGAKATKSKAKVTF